MGNKGGNSEDGAGDSTLGSLPSSSSINSGKSMCLQLQYILQIFLEIVASLFVLKIRCDSEKLTCEKRLGISIKLVINGR